jgi:hypothetical protein
LFYVHFEDPTLAQFACTKLAETEKSWTQTLTDVFRNELSTLESQIVAMNRQHCINLLPYLQVLSIPEYVEIMMQEVRRLGEGSESFSLSTRAMAKQLGSNVMTRYFVKRKVDTGELRKIEQLYDKYLNECVLEKGKQYYLPRVAWQKLIMESESGPDIVSGLSK